MLPNGSVPGERPADEEPALRLVFFGLSIVSDWENAAATSHRALLRALAERGHQVVFLEERRNAPTVGLLKQRGAAPHKAFDRNYPDVPYRTYELPPQREMDVWLGREASTADAIVAFSGTPVPCFEGLLRLEAGHTLRLMERPAPETGTDHVTEMYVPSSQMTVMPYAPVVSSREVEPADRDIEMLIVAYDDRELAIGAATVLPGATLLNCGSAMVPDSAFVPEVELPDWYWRARVTVVIDNQGPIENPVRALLPMACGSASVLVYTYETDPHVWPFFTSTVEQFPEISRQASAPATRADSAGGLQRYLAVARAIELEEMVAGHRRVSRTRSVGPFPDS
ncbi:hypothetical protein BH24CHL4_BH24CHL4_23120 [soil metagenome]